MHFPQITYFSPAEIKLRALIGDDEGRFGGKSFGDFFVGLNPTLEVIGILKFVCRKKNVNFCFSARSCAAKVSQYPQNRSSSFPIILRARFANKQILQFLLVVYNVYFSTRKALFFFSEFSKPTNEKNLFFLFPLKLCFFIRSKSYIQDKNKVFFIVCIF